MTPLHAPTRSRSPRTPGLHVLGDQLHPVDPPRRIWKTPSLTRLTQTVERLVTDRSAPAAADVAEDPAFNWDALRSLLDTTFPLPSTGVVQRVAAGFFAKLQSGGITGRDQHEARFVLDILAGS